MVDALGQLLARIEEILASKRFESERDWCRRAGVSESYIGALRAKRAKGDAQTAKLEQVEKLARAANVSVDYLLGRSRATASQGDDAGSSPNLRAALEAYPWADHDVVPTVARAVVQQVRSEAFAGGGVDLPQSYWHARIGRLVDEALGRAKVAGRAPARPTVDLSQESPEVREHKAKRRRL